MVITIRSRPDHSGCEGLFTAEVVKYDDPIVTIRPLLFIAMNWLVLFVVSTIFIEFVPFESARSTFEMISISEICGLMTVFINLSDSFTNQSSRFVSKLFLMRTRIRGRTASAG